MYRNIVVPIDLSDKASTKSVLPTVLNLVTNFNARLHLVHIIPDFGMRLVEDYFPKNWLHDQKKKHELLFNDLVAQYVPNDIQVDCYIGRGAVYDQVISYAEKVSADLIILLAVSPKQRSYMLGPNASKIIRHSNISVLVVRE